MIKGAVQQSRKDKDLLPRLQKELDDIGMEIKIYEKSIKDLRKILHTKLMRVARIMNPGHFIGFKVLTEDKAR